MLPLCEKSRFGLHFDVRFDHYTLMCAMVFNLGVQFDVEVVAYTLMCVLITFVGFPHCYHIVAGICHVLTFDVR